MSKPIEFARTGHGFIDVILAEIEITAGTFHNVNDWHYSADERRTYIDLINDWIESAGKRLDRMEFMIENGIGAEDVRED